MLELLRELCRERGVAIVLVSHDPMAARYADRVLALRDGRLGDYDADPNSGRRDGWTNRRFGGRACRGEHHRLHGGGCRWAPGESAHERHAAVKPSNVLLLYRVRLRARAAQECLAIVGIAAGVALLFASQVCEPEPAGLRRRPRARDRR